MSVVEEEEASGVLEKGSATANADSSGDQAPFLFSQPEFSAAVHSSALPPVELESHSFTAAHIPASSACSTHSTAGARPAEMPMSSVDPSTTASITVFSSSSGVSCPSSLQLDTAELVLPMSALDSSSAPGIAVTASASLTSTSRAISPPYSSSDKIQACSGIQSGDTRSESVGFSAPGDALLRESVSDIRGVDSGLLLTLPPSVAAVESLFPRPLEMSSPSQAAEIATEVSVLSSGDLSEHQRSVVLSSPSPMTDKATALPPDPPSYSIVELAALPTSPESSPAMPTAPEALALPDGGETDGQALPGLPPAGAMTGLLTEHERSSLETSTSLPSGISTISIPCSISKLRISKIPNSLSVCSSSESPTTVIIGPSLLRTDPAFAHSTWTSCLALLSVENASSSSSSAETQMPRSSSSFFEQLSTRTVIPDATVSSSPLQESISDIKSSGNLNDSTSVAPSIGFLSSSAPVVPTSLNLSTPCNTTSSHLTAGSGDSMDCSPPPSSHFTNVSSNSASNNIQVSRSLLELRSIKEEPKSKSGPPVLPTSETLPRRPARAGQKGEGWPYAPQGWPELDDRWFWKVGKRVHANGYFRDRSLGLPKGLCKGRKITQFSSKKSIVEYLKQNFPDLSSENFFKSFQWRIPYVNYWNSFSAPASKTNALKRQRSAEEGTNAPSPHKRSRKECKAGNLTCGLETGRSILLGNHASSACDICCTEPGFCRECKCILCCKTIVPEAGDSNFVRCVRKPSGSGMCGHAAHLECALNSKMAGVVKKRDLDMEYLCRRCDNRTDLRELVTLLLEAVGNTNVREHAEKSLELALEVMRGTERGGTGARVLESLVQTALSKVQSGVDIQDAFMELKDQGAAAEAARQQNLGRGPSLMEDISQQPEASLDQWLPSSGSPTSHPSPGTPSSFTSPRLKSNPSVTSGQLNGSPTVDGSLRKHRAAEGHSDHLGQAQPYHEGVTNTKYKNSHLGNKALIRNAGQARGSHRIRAVSSNVNNNGLEAMCESFTRTAGDDAAEPGSWDGNSAVRANHNSGTKALKDQTNPSSGAGKLRDEMASTETCKSCGAVKRHTSNAVEISSSLKAAKIEDGVKKGSLVPREEEPGDFNTYKAVAESDTRFAVVGRLRGTNSANGSVYKPGSSLHVLDLHCDQEMQAALVKLRGAQEAEFERAKASLTAKKESILRKYELLDASRRDFSEQPISSSLEVFDEHLLRTGTHFADAMKERDNFKTMLMIGEGFGSVSKDDLKKFYRWPPEN